MKPLHLLLSTVLLLIISCTSGDIDEFAGKWQHIEDPAKTITITQSGKHFYFKTSNIESSAQDFAGSYNPKRHALEFDNGNGTITTFVYDSDAKHLLALGEKFEKISGELAEGQEEEKPAEEENEDKDTSESITRSTSSETSEGSASGAKCGKGKILVISGNNVRLRTEPDVTKQNILMQFHKGYEVIHLDDKDVDGQKWYKVCYEGNTGWVSGQYAAMK